MRERPWMQDLARSLATPCWLFQTGFIATVWDLFLPSWWWGSTASCVYVSLDCLFQHWKGTHLLTLECRPHSEKLPRVLCAIDSALNEQCSYGWVMATVSCPQQPCSAPVDTCLWLVLCSQFTSYLVFLFTSSLLFFPALLSFPKNPAFLRCAQSRTVSVLSFLPPAILQT